MNLQCQTCGSFEVRKASMIFVSQTQVGQSGGVSITAKGRVTLHAGNRKNQSQLAAALAPPQAPGASGYYVTAFVLSVLGCLSLGSVFVNGVRNSAFATFTPVLAILWLIVSFFVIWSAIKFAQRLYLTAKANYDSQYEAWNSLWVCVRCGTMTQVTLQTQEV